jgi:photosystem II stability/assembly factor-like uncharacterized protein
MNTGIPLILNFDLKAPLPLDQRLSVDTTSELNSIPNPYSGMPVYSADTQQIYYLKNIINGQKTWIPVPAPDQFVVVTGDQSISGIKNFDTYPMVNVNGEMKRVITQGDQSLGAISGIPNFPENAVYNDNILLNSSSSGYLTGNGYSGNYDGGYFFGRTKITQNTNRIIDSSIGNNFSAITGTSITNPLPLTGSWRWLACSSDAKYITVSNDSNFLSASNDYGKTWYQTATGLGPRNWRGVSMSAAGKYQIAVGTNLTYAGIIANSEDYGITWSSYTAIPNTNAKTWVAPAISSDGKYQTVVLTDTSASLPSNPLPAYVSSDYGKNFSAFALPHDPSNNTRFVAMSSDGKYQTIVASRSIITSANYGRNWTIRPVPNQAGNVPFFSVSMTADGRFQIVVTSGSSNSDGEVYTSNNYGVTWKLVKTFGRNISITSVSNSDHGRLITISVKDGFIYTSSDYGNNWTLRTTAQSRTTTLTAPIDNSVTTTTIPLASVAGISLTTSRFLLIDDEIIYFQDSSTIVGNELRLVVRGYAGTTRSAHDNGAKVTLSSDWRRNVMSNDGKYQLSCEANFTIGGAPSTNLAGYIYVSVADEKIDGTIYADKFNSTNMQAETGIFNKASGSFILFNSATAPSSPARGQLFFDTINNNFSGYDGTSWLKLNN